MQHELSRRATTDLHAQFLNERVTSISRFHRRADKAYPDAIEQLDYGRERQVYLLTNGQRTIDEIARLLGMHPVDVARMVQQLLAKGYIELLPALS